MKELFIFIVLSITCIQANAGDENSVYNFSLNVSYENGGDFSDKERGKRSRRRDMICEISRNQITVSGLAKEQVINFRYVWDYVPERI